MVFIFIFLNGLLITIKEGIFTLKNIDINKTRFYSNWYNFFVLNSCSGTKKLISLRTDFLLLLIMDKVQFAFLYSFSEQSHCICPKDLC